MGRIAANLLALAVAVVTVAPIGLMVLMNDSGSRVLGVGASGADAAIETLALVFWLLLLGLAGYAMATTKRRVGAVLTWLVVALALLNAKGCIAGLEGIGRATGG